MSHIAPEHRATTPRLDLVAATVGHAEAELRGDGSLATLLGCAVPPSWPPGEYDRAAIEFLRLRMTQGGAACAGWYTWYAIERGTRTLVAAGGYFGPPVDGEVEIGYSVVPEARGRGVAADMARALVERAFAHRLVRSVRAHTFDHNPASIRVLEHCGLRRVGAGTEPGTVKFRRERDQ